MVTRVSSRASATGRFGVGRCAARLIGPAAVTALALLGSSVISPPAHAGQHQQLCGDRSQILKRLEQGHEETPRALGLSADGGVLEILVSPAGGWTILVTYPKRPTCVLAVGEAWQMLQRGDRPA
jgi:hypothetical protein